MHKRLFGLALASGCLFHLSQPPADLGPLVFVAFLPLFAAIRQVGGEQGEKKAAFQLGVVMGLVVYLAGFHFLTELAGVDLPAVALALLWLAVGGLLSVYFGLFALLARLVLRRSAGQWILLLPLAWTLLELPRYAVPAPAPVFFPGYSLHRLPLLIQTADLGGVHAVSFFVLAVNAALFAAFTAWPRRRRALSYCMVVMLLFLAQIGYGAWRLDDLRRELRHDGPQVALIQPNIAQAVKNKTDEATRRQLWQTHREQTLRLRGSRPDLIVWPETSFPWTLDVQGRPDIAVDVQDTHGERPDPRSLARQAGSTLVVGAYTRLGTEKADAAHNSAWAFDPSGEVMARHDKVFLVPGVEQKPGLLRELSSRLGGSSRHLVPGELDGGSAARHATLRDRSGREFSFSMNVCFEFAFPQLFARLHRRATPHFSVALSNEGWYGASSELDHALIMTRFRAIESRVSIVRAANTGITAVIDPTGTVIAKLEDATGADRLMAGELVTSLPYLPNPERTLFVRYAG